MRKEEHIRSLSSKLEDFMASLFHGRSDLPRLVLENMNSSHIEAQPNLSPELATYLDIADRNTYASGNFRERLDAPESTLIVRYSRVDLTAYDENEDSHNLDSAKSPLEW
jgi:hypothetical protein